MGGSSSRQDRVGGKYQKTQSGLVKTTSRSTTRRRFRKGLRNPPYPREQERGATKDLERRRGKNFGSGQPTGTEAETALRAGRGESGKTQNAGKGLNGSICPEGKRRGKVPVKCDDSIDKKNGEKKR